MQFFFVTDLHGHEDRYRKLFELLEAEKPDALFMGGDLIPHGVGSLSGISPAYHDFVDDFLIAKFKCLKENLGDDFPDVFLILGNDDSRLPEEDIIKAEKSGLWYYLHNRRMDWKDYTLYGYAFVPPTPFLLKDWDRYDVSRFVDPGCISPEEGRRTVKVSRQELRYSTIKEDLENLAGADDHSRTIFLFHSPPYQTNLDRAALDGQTVDHTPLDVHTGSIAIRRFIEEKEPLITLHGHIHESARLTGSWQDKMGRTVCYSAAHDGPELAVVKFDPAAPEEAERLLI